MAYCPRHSWYVASDKSRSVSKTIRTIPIHTGYCGKTKPMDELNFVISRVPELSKFDLFLLVMWLTKYHRVGSKW